MEYEAPVIEVVGTASDLIQNYFGNYTDGDGNIFSFGAGVIAHIDAE